MATNLRLRRETEDALRAEAERSGRSQQDLIREALDQFLGLVPASVSAERRSVDALYAAGLLRPPRTPYRRATKRLTLPEGVTSLDLLDREDRF